VKKARKKSGKLWRSGSNFSLDFILTSREIKSIRRFAQESTVLKQHVSKKHFLLKGVF